MIWVGQITQTQHLSKDYEKVSGGVLDINIVVVCLLHYISVKCTTVDIHSTIVPSVACQTTEGEYHSTNHLLPTDTL